MTEDEKELDAYEWCLKVLGEENEEQIEAKPLQGGEYAVYNLKHRNPYPGGIVGTFYPRRGYWRCDLLVGRDNNARVKDKLQSAGLTLNQDQGYFVSVRLRAEEVEQHQAMLREVLRMALAYCEKN